MEKIETASSLKIYFEKEIDSLISALRFAKGDSLTRRQLDKLKEDIKSTVKNGGRVVFTGIGKNVYACQKLAASYSSIGIPSFFLDAVHAVHGDLGVLRPGDLLIAQSKSGNTSELVNTLIHLDNNKEHFKIKTWGIDCKGFNTGTQNGFDKLCDETIHLDVESEIDTLNMVPTVSALVLQAIGDIVGVSAAEDLGFNGELFAINHPGGTIGKTLSK